MSSIMKIKNIKFRDALVNHDEGETVYCEEEKKCFMWHDGKWIDVPGEVTDKGHFEINYRDLMMNTIQDFEPLNAEQLERVRSLIRDFVWKESSAHYYALVNFSEAHQPYFTLFVPKSDGEDIGQALIECLQSRGDFIYMEDWGPDTDNFQTFWVREVDTKRLKEFYLANYDGGVIEYA